VYEKKCTYEVNCLAVDSRFLPPALEVSSEMQPDQARLPFQYRRRGLKSGLVGYTECGAVFGTGAAAAVVEAGGRNVSVTEPFRGAQGVRTEAPQNQRRQPARIFSRRNGRWPRE
jgi:hypothetical protein